MTRKYTTIIGQYPTFNNDTKSYHISLFIIQKLLHWVSVKFSYTKCNNFNTVVIKYNALHKYKCVHQVWSDAAVQVFYSSSLGIGELLTLSSHNRFKNNCQRYIIYTLYKQFEIMLRLIDTNISMAQRLCLSMYHYFAAHLEHIYCI